MRSFRSELLLCALLILLLPMTTVGAQGPTMTPFPTFTPWPTLSQLSPTATSQYQGFRVTPTPLSITPSNPAMEQFEIIPAAENLADQIIQGYNALNVSGALDMISFIAMAAICIAMLMRIQHRSTRNHD